MVGLGALNVRRAINLILTADIAACMSLEALHGTDRAYDPRVHAARPHPRQIDCAALLAQALKRQQADPRKHRQQRARPIHPPLCPPSPTVPSVTQSPTSNG